MMRRRLDVLDLGYGLRSGLAQNGERFDCLGHQVYDHSSMIKIG